MNHTDNGSATPDAGMYQSAAITPGNPHQEPAHTPTPPAQPPVASTADQQLDAAFAAYDDADTNADDDVLFAYEPEVLFDPLTGDTRLSVSLPISDDTVQPVHIPLDPTAMAALVAGLAEARDVRRRAEAAAAGIDPDTIAPAADSAERNILSMQGFRDTVAGRRLVDPAGIAGIRADDLPPVILGLPRQQFFVAAIGGIVLLSILLAILL